MSLDGVRVLLAEDNPTNQLVAGQMLESLGAIVTLARDGAEALEIAERETFDVMLIDIEMPRVNGTDVIRRIREWSAPRAETPMIALTAYVMREHRAAIEAAGADGIIAKPILSIEQFGHDIRRWMSQRSTEGNGRSHAGFASHGATSPEIDRSIYEALQQAIGDASMGELLDRVDADIESARERLSAALQTGATDEVRAAAHVLISVGGAIGATRLQESARNVHDVAKPESAAAAAAGEGVDVLLGDIDRVREFVRRERSRCS